MSTESLFFTPKDSPSHISPSPSDTLRNTNTSWTRSERWGRVDKDVVADAVERQRGCCLFCGGRGTADNKLVGHHNFSVGAGRRRVLHTYGIGERQVSAVEQQIMAVENIVAVHQTHCHSVVNTLQRKYGLYIHQMLQLRNIDPLSRPGMPATVFNGFSFLPFSQIPVPVELIGRVQVDLPQTRWGRLSA